MEKGIGILWSPEMQILIGISNIKEVQNG